MDEPIPTASALCALVPEPLAHERAKLDEIAGFLVAGALRRGASDAVVRVSESDEFAVTVRNARPEKLQRSGTQSVSLTVYNGQRKGSASSSNLSSAALTATLEAAWHIAHYSGADAFAGPAETSWLETAAPDLDLYHPWDLSTDGAIELALRAESAARAFGEAIVNCNGTSVSAQHGQFSLATSRGFLGGYRYSSHGLDCSVIASNGGGMQTGGWGMTRRMSSELDTPELIGRRAAERAHAMLDARKLPTGAWPVLFEAPIASSLINSLVSAVTGELIYRGQSFLPDSLGQVVLAEHLNLNESPHELCGLASAPFDDEGVRTVTRQLVRDGVLHGYFLSAYAARKLGMASTGNAGGAHNLRLTSTLTRSEDDFAGMLRRLDRGLLVSDLMGQGINHVTGDYSRGASGFWVEDGQIQYPVQEITIAGNLRDMLRGIVAVGADVHVGPTRTGSILVDRMRIAGL
ncbi:metalloprotease PmbA [Paraburkholderia sediminicola]|uniref:metalloprotease PmbA n=1 Tax=Paraburkholderia sediminicola TaxID=458836 RepID=UPI0038BC89A3